MLSENITRDDLLPQYTLAEALALLYPAIRIDERSSVKTEKSAACLPKLFAQKEAPRRLLRNVTNLELDLDYMRPLAQLFVEVELQYCWERVYAPIVRLAENMAGEGREVLVRTKWDEFDWQRQYLGSGGSRRKGLTMVRERDERSVQRYVWVGPLELI